LKVKKNKTPKKKKTLRRKKTPLKKVEKGCCCSFSKGCEKLDGPHL